MKHFLFWMTVIMNTSIIYAQVNINPNPYGNPWIVGGIPDITPEIQSELDSLPSFQINPSHLIDSLPLNVDNSERIYMRKIFEQYGNSCAQAATVGYMFTYELNYKRNIPSNHDSVCYHPSFTYNFLNFGSADSGTFIQDGLKILKEMGCPTIESYGTTIGNADSTEWMNGYEKYYIALHNRIIKYEKIDFLEDSALLFV